MPTFKNLKQYQGLGQKRLNTKRSKTRFLQPLIHAKLILEKQNFCVVPNYLVPQVRDLRINSHENLKDNRFKTYMAVSEE